MAEVVFAGFIAGGTDDSPVAGIKVICVGCGIKSITSVAHLKIRSVADIIEKLYKKQSEYGSGLLVLIDTVKRPEAKTENLIVGFSIFHRNQKKFPDHRGDSIEAGVQSDI